MRKNLSLPPCRILAKKIKAICIMKISFRPFKAFLALAFLFGFHSVSFSQPPPPSAPHGFSGNSSPEGTTEGAPIGEGMFLLFGLAGLYGGKKLYDFRKTPKVKEVL